MADLSDYNPTGRFTGLAENYAKYRPSYPAAAIDFILTHCALGPHSHLADVGCGTGISSRLFAERGILVIGIDPNDEMRSRAEQAQVGNALLTYRQGSAEATGLPDANTDAVLAAQAFHWFKPEPTLREFHRILRPGGWVILMWNERDETDPCTAAYGKVIRSAPDAAAVEGPRGQAGQVLLDNPLFVDAARFTFTHEQILDQEGLQGRAFSASYAPREQTAAHAFATGLHEVFAQWQCNGFVTLRYETTVYLARKPACSL
jgi:ubiquinone/menaquinone biosynthesis C-methylase UbiE